MAFCFMNNPMVVAAYADVGGQAVLLDLSLPYTGDVYHARNGVSPGLEHGSPGAIEYWRMRLPDRPGGQCQFAMGGMANTTPWHGLCRRADGEASICSCAGLLSNIAAALDITSTGLLVRRCRFQRACASLGVIGRGAGESRWRKYSDPNSTTYLPGP